MTTPLMNLCSRAPLSVAAPGLDAAAGLEDTLAWKDSGGVCDGNNIPARGVPVLDTVGACGQFIHSPEKYLDTASLAPKAQLTALVLHRLDQGKLER